MKLTGQQFRQVQDVLLGAYDRNGLRMLARIRLGVNLDTLTRDDNLSVVVFDLIAWAEQSGRVGDLVFATSADRPNNQSVQQLVEDYAIWETVAADDVTLGANPQAIFSEAYRLQTEGQLTRAQVMYQEIASEPSLRLAVAEQMRAIDEELQSRYVDQRGVVNPQLVRSYPHSPARTSYRYVAVTLASLLVIGIAAAVTVGLGPLLVQRLAQLGATPTATLRPSATSTMTPSPFTETPSKVEDTLVFPTNTPSPARVISGCQPSRTVFMVGEPGDQTWSIECTLNDPEHVSRIEVRKNGTEIVKSYALAGESVTLLEGIPIPTGEVGTVNYQVLSFLNSASEPEESSLALRLIDPILVVAEAVRLRSAPYLSSNGENEVLQVGTAVRAKSSPFESDGQTWIEVTANEKVGYSALEYLQPNTGVDVSLLASAVNVPPPPTASPTQLQTATATPRPTLRPTPTIEPIIIVNDRDERIVLGDSVRLQWRIENVSSIHLNDRPVVGTDNGGMVTMDLTPTEDTIYVWVIKLPNGRTEVVKKNVYVSIPTPSPAKKQ